MDPFSFSSTFGFNINWEFWGWLLDQPTADAVIILFAIIGWVILFLIFFYMGETLWHNYRFRRNAKKWEWSVLAVDIPPLYIQTPKAVEQIFAHLSGARINRNIWQKYWEGKKQKHFSFEIISIEGYIQFLIRVEKEYRDLIEAAIYAQYPEAEITEVEDYVEMIPKRYPNETHDLFGIEFKLADKEAFPIRTYPSFEYSLSKDVVFSDPMAAILENFSRIGHGENFWLQMIIEPIGNQWKEKGIELVKKIIANKKETKSSWLSYVGSIPMALTKELLDYLNGVEFDPKKKPVKSSDEKPEGKIMDLSPGNKDIVSAIEEKIAKIGFRTKIRALYAARKEVYHPGKCTDGLVGAFNQFHIMNRNAIVPYSITKAFYAFSDYRVKIMKNKFYRSFVKRFIKMGATPYVLNIEELATIWHFPLPFVKTPLMQKASAKRGEPPMNLPLETSETPLRPKAINTAEPKVEVPAEPDVPEELPYG